MAAILGFAAQFACGQAADARPPAPLTLAEARRRALEKNADFHVAQIQVEAALAQLKAAREFPNPTLGLTTTKISTDETPAGTELGNSYFDRAYDSIVSLSQLFPVGKRGLQRDAASAGVRAAEFLRDDARRILLQSVTQAYAAALSALDQAGVLAQSAAKLRREAAIAADRFKAGDISVSDKLQLEIAADQDELNAEGQRATARAAVVILETLLGEPQPEGKTPLGDTLEGLAGAIDPGLESDQVGSRPDIAAAEAIARQAETNLRLQRRQRIPDLTVSVQYERNPPSQTNTIGMGVSLPVPLWNRYDGEILGAKAVRDQAQAQLDKTRRRAAADVATARIAYHEASARASRYQTVLLPKSAEVARSVAYSYEKGGAALVDLLQAERNDNMIRVASVQAQADAASAAVALRAALGGIPEDPSTPALSPP